MNPGRPNCLLVQSLSRRLCAEDECGAGTRLTDPRAAVSSHGLPGLMIGGERNRIDSGIGSADHAPCVGYCCRAWLCPSKPGFFFPDTRHRSGTYVLTRVPTRILASRLGDYSGRPIAVTGRMSAFLHEADGAFTERTSASDPKRTRRASLIRTNVDANGRPFFGPPVW